MCGLAGTMIMCGLAGTMIMCGLAGTMTMCGLAGNMIKCGLAGTLYNVWVGRYYDNVILWENNITTQLKLEEHGLG